MKTKHITAALMLLLMQDLAVTQTWAQSDPRNIATGPVIPDESYSDQPYIVKTNDGAWLCVMTTGAGHEGATGQHIITWRSFDQGKTWIDKQDVEPIDGPEASYAVLLKAPSGRVFVFYDHNTDNLRYVKGDNPPYKDGQVKRVDSQGYFVFKYSDDHGKTWSAGRYTIPVREFEIDRNNPYQGKIRFFWNVGKAFAHKNAAYVPIHKVGGFGEGFFTSSEGALLRSDNLFTVKDPAKATWATLPDGDIGLRTPAGGGPIAEEQSFTVLSDGSLYCVYRTIDGYPVYTYSRNGGRTWDAPQYLRYADGRLVKHPRAANFVWRCENGKYLYWFHNHGGKFISEHPQRRSMAYNDRNPVWVLGGIEKDSDKGKIIQWTQPEILLYDDDPMIRMSYPDLVEDKGNYYITETQKDIARVHPIDKQFLDVLWGQFGNKKLTEDGLVTTWSDKTGKFPQKVPAPSLADFSVRNNTAGDFRSKNTEKGFTIDLEFSLNDLSAGQILLDARHAGEKGWLVRTADKKTIEIVLNDGRTQSVWSCDEAMLKEKQSHRVTIIVDGGPRVIAFVVDGKLNDGGDTRQFGWSRFNPYLQSVSGAKDVEIGSRIRGVIKTVRVYNRALKTSEAIGNYHAGK
ncbi:exo-alpha-sialidase [Dyadobacter sp. CY323]|uniref:exo-alpha-sialidase n=1 Tax=Dyadobacter sp. CY323 TaxID=2907302 RepID=UPI001F1FA924|nr:exo-alpha-sialidase [Dyadobacter sp. CY323]MCE6989706.1 exo-alpha-sialidase [Dyadobacter sp. CY323]